MRAILIRAQGGLDVVAFEKCPDPVAAVGEALVRVAFCALNHHDLFVVRGMPGLPVEFPRILGTDMSGTVAAVGPGVDGSWIGKRVMVDNIIKRGNRILSLGDHLDGGLADFIRIPVENLIELPPEVSDEAAAALPTAYGTALRMLVTRGRVRPGELVLVLGASGGVGVACVQILKEIGARTIACASAPEKLAKLSALGADHVVDYSREDFSAAAWRLSDKKGVDIVINFTGGDTWVPSIRALRLGGRLLTCGATAGFDPKEDIRYIWRRELDIMGSNGWDRHDLLELIDRVRTGRLDPVIDRIFPLERTRDALAHMQTRAVFGKILVAI
jgi:NADPH:quinone reductase-like Zn-dependent oxidoreductase